MTVAEKLKKIADNEQQVYNAGVRDEYERFWFHATNDLAYNPNNVYNFAFAGKCWNDKTFRLKYDITPNYCANMFLESSINDLVQDLKESEGKLSFERVTSLGQVFQRCERLTYVPEIYAPKATSMSMTFSECTRLRSVGKITVSADCTHSNTFYKCTNLRDISFGSVIRSDGWGFVNCPNLTRESIWNIVEALDGGVSGTITLSRTAVDREFGSPEFPEDWSLLAATKPSWTIALA